MSRRVVSRSISGGFGNGDDSTATRLRGLAVALIAAALLALLVTPVEAKQEGPSVDRVVVPTGVYPTDLDNVQAAVDLGGIVLLASSDDLGVPTAFNFGPTDFPGATVLLTNDVEILGEKDHEHQTTIVGSPFAFFGTEPIESKISGIHFDGQSVSAVIYISSSGAEFTNNLVTNVSGNELPWGVTEGRGVKFLSNFDPERFTGQIVVADNVFDHLHADLSDAIVFDSVAAEVVISGNTISNIEASGILVLGHRGVMNIENNTIRPGPGIVSPFSTGNGIVIVGGNEDAQYRITGNDILTENPWADGILLLGDSYSGQISNPVISNNSVEVSASNFGAITLLGDVTGASVTSNEVRGSGSLGISFLYDYYDGFSPSKNTAVGNNLATYSASDADVYFDILTTDNLLAGFKGTVIDLGTNNAVTGEQVAGNPAIGQKISEAQHLKKEKTLGN